MRIDYTLMQGAGNRILVVDARPIRSEPPAADRLQRLADERTGPGFDQLMWITPTEAGGIAGYRVFNADGSEVEQCGNGVRCVASLLAESMGAREFVLDAPAGAVQCRVLADGRVSVNMGAPCFDPPRIPFIADRAANVHEVSVNGTEYAIGAVSMGNPHCVLEVGDVDAADVARIGAQLETHERFPARTNVGFMAIEGRGAMKLRVWERGVGETLACGTGACAAVAVAQRRGQVGREVTVSLPGGQLVVSCAQPGDAMWLTGDAEKLSEGTIET
jgi:diaminopimelate epimerase